ncbi:MAG: hypothetical protein CMH55_09775 [Myxococcales bacterium]|nr:hypothetical protein [Myxococcales bacterium]
MKRLALLTVFVMACGPGPIEAPPWDAGPDLPEPTDAGPLDAAPPTQGDDHANNVYEATVIEPVSRTEGEIHYGGDRDFFRFTTTEAGIFIAWTDGNLDTYCELLTSEGRFLVGDDDSAEGRNCQVRYELRAQRDYVIKVKHYRSQGLGAYGLNLVGPIPADACGNGEVDPGEQCDDGNQANWDGCSRDCMVEELPSGCEELETERPHATFLCNEGQRWAEALETCQSFGGSLATIDSDEDSAWFGGLAGGAWMGMNDRQVEGEWRWSGRDSDYRNWNNNEPNDHGRGEDCGQVLGNGRWNDADCNRASAFFCER